MNWPRWRRGLAALERQRREFKRNCRSRRPRRATALATTAGDGDAPEVIHQPVTTAPAGQPLTITAEVRDPSGVKWVRLRYRSVNQHQDYRTLPMLPTGEKDQYRAVIPAEHIVPTWDLMYFIEVMDQRWQRQDPSRFEQGDALHRRETAALIRPCNRITQTTRLTHESTRIPEIVDGRLRRRPPVACPPGRRAACAYPKPTETPPARLGQDRRGGERAGAGRRHRDATAPFRRS